MFTINSDMFGLYARIPTGFSREPHIYKIVAKIESNCYCEVPLGTCITKQINHEDIVPVLLVIHCGLDESKVIRVKEDDCEIVNSRLSELAEADNGGRVVILEKNPNPCDSCTDGWGNSNGDKCEKHCQQYKDYYAALTRESAESALEEEHGL